MPRLWPRPLNAAPQPGWGQAKPPGWLWRAYERLAQVIGLGALALVCLSWTPFALLLNPVLPPRLAKPLGRRAIMTGFRLYSWVLRALCACRLDLKALDGLAREPGPLVVVANHPSLLDAVLITSRLPNAVCIMKAALMHNLLLGAGARMAGYIVNDAPLPMMRSAITELKAGATLLIFPEGTRTATAPVSACSSTAGVLAARAGVPVQTVLIELVPWYLGKGWPLWRPPRLPLHCRVRLGVRLAPEACGQRFGAEIERYFRAELGTAPPGADASATTPGRDA